VIFADDHPSLGKKYPLPSSKILDPPLNTVPNRRRFTDIYDRKLYKTTVYFIIFGHLNHCNHRPGLISEE